MDQGNDISIPRQQTEVAPHKYKIGEYKYKNTKTEMQVQKRNTDCILRVREMIFLSPGNILRWHRTRKNTNTKRLKQEYKYKMKKYWLHIMDLWNDIFIPRQQGDGLGECCRLQIWDSCEIWNADKEKKEFKKQKAHFEIQGNLR